MNRIKLFLSGALCFLLTQPLTRMPLLSLMRTNLTVSLWLTGIIGLIFLSFTAGLFEETGRGIFCYRIATDDGKDPIYFGLRHGLCEVVILYTMMGWSIYQWVERPIAILFHITNSILVWRGYERGKLIFYTGIAVLTHTLFNLSPFLIQSRIKNPWVLEAILGAMTITYFMAVRALRRRKME